MEQALAELRDWAAYANGIRYSAVQTTWGYILPWSIEGTGRRSSSLLCCCVREPSEGARSGYPLRWLCSIVRPGSQFYPEAWTDPFDHEAIWRDGAGTIGAAIADAVDGMRRDRRAHVPMSPSNACE